MTEVAMSRARLPALKLGLAVGVALAMLLAAAYFAVPVQAAPASAGVAVAGGSTQQWAFGGTASASYSCTGSACGANSTLASLDLRYYVQYVVIYTSTNISSTQTQIEVQEAVNASVSLSASESGLSLAATVTGQEQATGFTNLTNAGSVNVSGSGPTTALAILNAGSSEEFNVSATLTVSNASSPSTSGSENFDLGGNEASSVSFSPALGLVPLNPTPGESWNASSAYTASGHYTAGYSVSENVGGQSYSDANWTSYAVAPSGTLWVNGTDLGAFTLTDNYTTPPTSVTAQAILLEFSNGAFSGSDGYLLAPNGIYDGLDGGIGVGLIAGQHPAQSSITSSSESTYYQSGVGFIGVDEGTNASAEGIPGASFSLQAGPEPVSVAQSQYSGIVSPSSSSSSSFPWIWVAVAVVVVVVVLAVLLMVRRGGRKTTAAPAPGAENPAMSTAPGAPAGPTGPATSSAPAMAAPAGAAAVAPICPTCGQPGTYVAQYGRYYCWTDKQYL